MDNLEIEDNDMASHYLYALAFGMAVKVDFLSSSEEIKRYANALYNAMVWGRNHTVK